MDFSKFFTKKPITELIADGQETLLERTLGAWQLVLIGIGAIVGAGIFVLIGAAAAYHAGPAVIISFLLGAVACACAGLCYAELSSSIPISGGAYTFIYASMGELLAWLVMGMMLLTYILGAATVASGWSGYIVSFLGDYGIIIPASLTHHTGHIIEYADGSSGVAIMDLPACFIVLLMTSIVYRGAESAAWVNSAIVAIKMSILLLFIVIGSFFVDPKNWLPFIPENTSPGHFGFSGIVSGATIVLLAFTGFDAVAATAQEAKNPQRDLPIGILGSLLVCSIFYMLISAVLTGIVPYAELGVAQPMAIAVDKMQMPWFSVFIKIGAVAGLTSVIMVMIYSAVRSLFATTHDGLLPGFLAACHPKFRTPHVLTVVVGALIAIMASMLPLEHISKLANFGTMVTFAMVCAATLYLRYTMPELPRSFSCPFVPFIPLAGIVLFVSIILAMPIQIFLYVAIWMLFMLFVYFNYSCKHSKLLRLKKDEQ